MKGRDYAETLVPSTCVVKFSLLSASMAAFFLHGANSGEIPTHDKITSHFDWSR